MAPWRTFKPEVPARGRILIYYSTKSSEWPIRDVDDSHGLDHRLEPNLETGTYNFFASCNQNHVAAMVMFSKERYVFFATKYSGTVRKFQGRLILAGYYTIDEVVQFKDGRIAVRSRAPYFISMHNPLTVDQVWRALFRRNGPKNARYAKRLLTPDQTKRLLGMMHSRKNAFGQYVGEIRRLGNSSVQILPRSRRNASR